MAQRAQTKNHSFKPSRKRVIILIIAVLTLYVVIPGLSGFRDAITSWQHANVGWAMQAMALFVATYVSAACVYRLLAVYKLRLGVATLIQMAAMFVNRLLPAGTGAIGVNYLYLRRAKHSKTQAAAVVTTNNVLGFVGHMLLLLAVLVSGQYHARHEFSVNGMLVALVLTVLVLAVLMLATWQRRKVLGFITGFLVDLAAYRKRPARLLGALLFAMLTTVLYSGVLYAAAQALHVDITAVQAFIILTAGVAGSTIIPTPGGIGGAEAGLVAGLVLYGVSDAQSLSVALFYRLITYWLALAIGAGALAVATRQKYLG